MDEKKKLTSVAGAPVVDNQNSVTAGPRGPMLLQDVWFLEKLAHFDREEGNWDLVGNNTPVFFIRDPLKFPDLNQTIRY